MIHLGDISAINGHNVPPVDCVIGGSPCQDLSVAGKRIGLAGARSGLFMEQIRIVREMRDADIHRGRTGQFVRPRFTVWENVPGAFSSNKGQDFRIVLEETIRIAEPEAPDIPLPPKGKWPMADAWYGDGWSVAYRVLDAQFWGVPQRRRRIALIADFGGHAAPEICFVRQSVCGDIAEGGTSGKTAAAGIEVSTGAAIALRMRAGCEGGGKGALIQVEKVGALGCNNNQTIFCAGFNPHAGRTRSIVYEVERAPTIDTGSAMAVYDARGNGDGKTVCTLTGDYQSRVTDYTAIVVATGQGNAEILRELCPTLNCNHEQPIVIHPVTSEIARRLTPLEYERLQGYPDGWTDIGTWTDSKGKRRKCSDAARYKALGNSIALPPWKWILKRLCACYERDATMASLFDGIGGFPLIWEQLNGIGSCLWASEIEEFPIAVTKLHFGEVEKNRE